MFTKNYNLLSRDPTLSHLVDDFIVEPMEEVVEPEFAAGWSQVQLKQPEASDLHLRCCWRSEVPHRLGTVPLAAYPDAFRFELVAGISHCSNSSLVDVGEIYTDDTPTSGRKWFVLWV